MYNEKIILTPQDIVEKDFKINARGYSAQEVDKFLDLVIKDYTEFNKQIKRLIKENEALNSENNSLRKEVRNLKELQDVVREEANNKRQVSNVDLLQRLSQLEKIVYGKSEE